MRMGFLKKQFVGILPVLIISNFGMKTPLTECDVAFWTVQCITTRFIQISHPFGPLNPKTHELKCYYYFLLLFFLLFCAYVCVCVGIFFANK
jgi:hypothetical protein